MAITDNQRQIVARLETLDPTMIDVLAKKTPGQRLAIAHGMWRSARKMLRHLLQSEHPEWSRQQADAETARRLSRGTR
jgi:hypothetical protein